MSVVEISSLSPVWVLGDETQGIRPGDKHLYPLSPFPAQTPGPAAAAFQMSTRIIGIGHHA